MTKTETKFNPNDHLTNIKGKDYLEVKWRLVWFREEHKDWGIETKVADRGDGWALMKATIKDEKGRVLANGFKSETKSDFGDYLEKAETGAIGRALALLGYGTQFAPELEEGERIVDSPVEKKTPQKASSEVRGASKPTDVQAKVNALREDMKNDSERIVCPKCGVGHVVQKTTRTGKTGYGCSDYAETKCDFWAWTRPEGFAEVSA